MNDDLLEGKWDRVKQKLKARWDKLTDDDIKRVEGRHEALGGLLERHYGLPKDKAEADGKAFFADVDGKQAGPHTATSDKHDAGPTTSAPGAQPAKAAATAPVTHTGKPKR